jgi:hypothetical protein
MAGIIFFTTIRRRQQLAEISKERASAIFLKQFTNEKKANKLLKRVVKHPAMQRIDDFKC